MPKNITPFQSETYDSDIKRTMPYYSDFFRQVIDIVSNCSFKQISWLDVGCGTGKMAEIALNELDIKKFVCCDCSSDMLKRTRERLNFLDVEYIQSQVQDLQLNSQFNVITSILVTHYLKDNEKRQAINRCYHALKDNGILFILENFAPHSAIVTNLYLKRWKNYQLNHGKSTEESQKHIDRFNKDYFPVTIEENIQLLKDCGFRYIDIFWLSYMQAGILGLKN